MLQIDIQSQLAAAIVRAHAIAVGRAASTILLQGLAFWSLLLRTAAGQPSPVGVEPQRLSNPPADSPFASYRSAGGHAAAQVIVPEAVP